MNHKYITYYFDLKSHCTLPVYSSKNIDQHTSCDKYAFHPFLYGKIISIYYYIFGLINKCDHQHNLSFYHHVYPKLVKLSHIFVLIFYIMTLHSNKCSHMPNRDCNPLADSANNTVTHWQIVPITP